MALLVVNREGFSTLVEESLLSSGNASADSDIGVGEPSSKGLA